MTTELVTVHAPEPEPSQSLALIGAAIDKGLTVEAIEKLVLLHREEQDREARREFNRAFAAFQAACPPIPRSSVADFTTKSGARIKFSFSASDEIASCVARHLQPLGFSYSWTQCVENGIATSTFTLRHKDGHSESSSVPIPVGSGVMGPAVDVNIALAIARRLSMIAGLGLTTGEPSDDGMEAGVEPITPEQVATLEALIQEVKADRAKFLAYIGVGDLADLRAAGFTRAIGALESKRRKP